MIATCGIISFNSARFNENAPTISSEVGYAPPAAAGSLGLMPAAPGTLSYADARVIGSPIYTVVDE